MSDSEETLESASDIADSEAEEEYHDDDAEEAPNAAEGDLADEAQAKPEAESEGEYVDQGGEEEEEEVSEEDEEYEGKLLAQRRLLQAEEAAAAAAAAAAAEAVAAAAAAEAAKAVEEATAAAAAAASAAAAQALAADEAAPAPAEEATYEDRLGLKWIRLDARPFGRRIENPKLSAALTSGKTEFTHEEYAGFNVNRNLHDDTFYIEVGLGPGMGSEWYEPVPEEGSVLCPLCRVVWLTVTPDGWVSTSAQPGRGACACSVESFRLAPNPRAFPLEQLRERVDECRRGGSLVPSSSSKKKASSTAQTAEATSSVQKGTSSTMRSSSPTGAGSSTSVRRKSKGVRRTPPNSARGPDSFNRALQSPLSSVASETAPGALIRNEVTEALVRRFEFERRARELGDEQREAHHGNVHYMKEIEELRKQHAMEIVAAERKQKLRVGEARRSVFDAKEAQGRDILQQRSTWTQELESQKLTYDERQKRRVEDTRRMQERALQNVFDAARAGGTRAKEAQRKGKQEIVLLEAERDDVRQKKLEQKCERARRERDQMPGKIAAARALWAGDRVQAGETLRAIGNEGKLVREDERLTRLQTALVFKGEVSSWQVNSRFLRAQIDEDRRQRAQATREQRVVHEDVCHRAAIQSAIERKESHDRVCLSRQADEELVEEYQEFQLALATEADSYADKRLAAAKRATLARKQGRRQERGRLRGLMLQLSLRPKTPRGEKQHTPRTPSWKSKAGAEIRI